MVTVIICIMNRLFKEFQEDIPIQKNSFVPFVSLCLIGKEVRRNNYRQIVKKLIAR